MNYGPSSYRSSSYGPPPYGPPGPPGPPSQPQYVPPVRSSEPSSYMSPEPRHYVPPGIRPSQIGFIGAFMVLFGSILMAIPQFWMASLPEELTETDMQILLALPGLAWVVIGVGVLLLVIGLQKSIMMT